MNIQTINDVSDCVPLYLPHSLYLKPVAKFKVSVSLPTNKLGKTISNYDIMDKLNSAIKPDKFLILKVSKSTIEFIRFDGELENIQKLRKVLSRLDGYSFRLNGFSEPFKVRASECRDEFPSRHDWDSFFRDARNMDEMKAGERPDTIHITNLPIRWFCPRHLENDENVKPSENIFKRIFEKFGSVRCVDIPICDLYRSKMKTEITGMKTFSFDNEVMFEGYIQFSEYVGFVKTMDEFRGMKLVKKCGDKNQAVNIIVNFDKTKHLSDASIKRRTIVRDRLMAKERAKQEDEVKKKKEEEAKAERERKRQEDLKLQELEKQHEREEKRKEKHLKKLQEKGNLEINHKIKMEERKLMIAQRKLESIRILEALFERIKLKETLNNRTNKNSKMQVKESNKKLDTIDLRNKLINRYKSAQEEILEKQKSKLAQVKGRTGLLALLKEKNKSRSPSVNSISSDDLSDVLSDSNLSESQKKKRIKRKKKKGDDSSTELSLDEEGNEEQPVANQYTGMFNSEMVPPEWFQMGFYPYGAHMFPGIPPSLRPTSAGPINNYNRGFYPYGAHMFPGMSSSLRPNFNNSMNNYKRGRGQGRGGRGRGHYNNNNYNSHNTDKYNNKYTDDNYEENDHYQDDRKRDSRSYSRSRSRSRSKSYRKHSRSRRSRSRRSRSRSSRHRSRRRGRSRSRSRSHSRSRSKSYSKHKSKKLVSTRRSKSISSSSGRSRTRSRSRSRHRRSWSRRSSRSNSKNSKNNGKNSSKRSRTSKSSEKTLLQPEKLVLSTKEIQRSVQQKLQERLQTEENTKKFVNADNISEKYKAPIKDPFTRDHIKENSVEKRHKNPFSTSRSRSRSKSKSRKKELFNRNNRKDSISPIQTSPSAKKQSSKKDLSPCSTASSTRTRSESRSDTPEKKYDD